MGEREKRSGDMLVAGYGWELATKSSKVLFVGEEI